MIPGEAVRLCAALAQCEIALVLRDPAAPALLSQAARHADGLPPGDLVAAAAALARAGGGDPGTPEAAAARKAAQALCRAAVIVVDAALLDPPSRA